MKKIIYTFFFIASYLSGQSQTAINMQVVDKKNNGISNVAVRAADGSVHTVTGSGGFFRLNVKLPQTLIFEADGFVRYEQFFKNEPSYPFIELVSEKQEESLTVGGFTGDTLYQSIFPAEIISNKDLRFSGQTQLDKAITFTTPAFNSTQQTISDATAHFDPYNFRALGAGRTLFLVNGKRKNPSSLLYINDTPGKGEVGVDMRSLSIQSIDRIEILSDGAAVRYGSDAMAGVVNIILKKSNFSDVRTFTGLTEQGDGFKYGFDFNSGITIGEKGFLNLTSTYVKEEATNRPGNPGAELIPGLDGMVTTSADELWITENPNLGTKVGQPETQSVNLNYNLSLPIIFPENKAIDSRTQRDFYSFGGINFRKGISFAVHRAPYWVKDPNFIFHQPDETYQGFLPTFEVDVVDNFNVFGLKTNYGKWAYDLSYNIGQNKVDYTVNSTINPALGANSPTNFTVGGYEFQHQIFNLNLEYKNQFLETDFGMEYRKENFISNAGEIDAREAVSFPAIRQEDEVNKVRSNFGFFTDVSFDLFSRKLRINFGGRYEDYSDFGENFSWKVAARLKTFSDKLIFRASASTGFKAPSIHQFYFNSIQTLVSDGSISDQGTFNHESPILRALDIPQLKNEESFNLSAGFTFKPNKNFKVFFNLYQIEVNDRIVFSSSISGNPASPELNGILSDFNITSLKFFTNAINTSTRGLDFKVDFSKNLSDYLSLTMQLGSNFNQTQLVGEIKTPATLAAAGISILDRKELSRILYTHPESKAHALLRVEFPAVDIGIQATRFGAVTWQHSTDKSKDQTFSARTLIDLSFTKFINRNFNFSLRANNVFDVYPDEIDNRGDPVTNLGGRLKYPWEVNQFGYLGRSYLLSLNLVF